MRERDVGNDHGSRAIDGVSPTFGLLRFAPNGTAKPYPLRTRWHGQLDLGRAEPAAM